MSKMNIALFGAGLIGREHAKLIAASSELKLAVIADPSDDAKLFAKETGCAWTATYEEALANFRVDGAIVALPNNMHLAAGLACISAKVAVLIEKPVADNIVDAMQIARAQEATGVPVLVGHHRRHSPDIVAAKNTVETGALGKVLAVNGFWWTRKHDSYFDVEWRRKPGGGPLWINLIHEIDCLRMICGDIASVQAVSSNAHRGFDVEDTCAIIIEFASGALGTFTLSDAVASPYIWDVTSGQALYFPSQPEDCYYIGGTKGSLAIPTMTLWTYENDGDWWSQPQSRHVRTALSSCYQNQLHNFANVIRGTEKPVVSAIDGAMTVAVVAAIEEAAKTGLRVKVDEFVQKSLNRGQ